MTTFNSPGRYTIMDITITYEQPSMKNRFEIRYFDKTKPDNKYNVVIVEGSSYGSNSMLDVLQVVAEKAAQKVGSMDFYESMREYVMKNLPYEYDGYGDPFMIQKYKPKFSNHNIHKHMAIDFNADPNAEEWDELGYIHDTTYTISKKKPKVLDPGPDMNEINALPGIHEIAKHPITGGQLPIKDIIINLNDQHQWSREKVADWLETLDVDLRFKTEDDRLREQREKKIQSIREAMTVTENEIKHFADSMAKLQLKMAEYDLEIQQLLEEENEQG